MGGALADGFAFSVSAYLLLPQAAYHHPCSLTSHRPQQQHKKPPLVNSQFGRKRAPPIEIVRLQLLPAHRLDVLKSTTAPLCRWKSLSLHYHLSAYFPFTNENGKK
ncbi:hypothetical protein T4E_3744 [Trichinella pseudospiralis]|uniref:Uncharacterized protein n=1 Tax=Trichinella pseudospiralis TaxID=6337 RepID=A0A0V1FU11_TRIPS|nr:hypothetical protein T4E_3744 [Trichinella pseudospiralis]KRY89528.1 hypothetical protein T4D_7070 [Trichinella pseudospiralis]